ncbi:hypothetical protein BDR07DRAFT_1386606 [Suillus spraguei]|nr:hypothetical protein BDR07DRAFT_1386606 [Suillus spraguei]
MWDDDTEHWKGLSVIVIHGHPITVKYWPVLYRYGKDKQWKGMKKKWSDWQGRWRPVTQVFVPQLPINDQSHCMAPTVIDPMQCFAGLHNVLPLAADLEINANIEEDVAAEQETLISPSSGKEQSAPTMNMSMDASEFAKLQVTLMEVSKGVTEGTDAEYKSPKPSTKDRGHMDMLRRCSTASETCIGMNPMLEMVQAGNVANSAHAITSGNMFKLHNHNHLPENWTVQAYQPGGQKPAGGSGTTSTKNLDHWGGELV